MANLSRELQDLTGAEIDEGTRIYFDFIRRINTRHRILQETA